MRVAIVGAGAMGTLLGNGFCRAGHQVTVLDLPARIAQLQSSGELVVVSGAGDVSTARPHLVTTNFSELGTNDVIVIATKSQDLPAVAKDIGPATGDETTIVTIQNGIPWWYLQNLPHKFGNARIECLDPDRALERSIQSSQIVGCVAYPAANLDAAGRSHHVEGNRFPIGELDGATRERTRAVADLFESAGFKSRIIDDIRSEIWLKALGTLSINPISALTRATMGEICSHTETRELVSMMMHEAQEVASAFGASLRHTIEKRIEGAKAVGAHKTSMLQDVEQGRTLELDALMLAVMELADIAGIEVPSIRNIYACTELLNNTLRSGQD